MYTVTVLMSTYNGDKYIEEQIDSLLNQRGVEVNILVRDDGSSDKTISILKKYEKSCSLKWFNSKNMGPAKSFLELLKVSPKSDFYAFCDQDDIWLQNKLEIATNKLKDVKKDIPALYYGHTRLVDKDLKPIKSSKNSYDVFLDFYSCMINSNATGCTMVFNNALKDIVNLKNPDYVFMHDAWIHKICILSKGKLFYDTDVPILYRQHGGNVIGGTSTPLKKLSNRFKSLKNAECIRSKTIKSLKDNYSFLMTNEEELIAFKIANYNKNIKHKLQLLFDFKIKTPYLKRNILYKLAVLLGIF